MFLHIFLLLFAQLATPAHADEIPVSTLCPPQFASLPLPHDRPLRKIVIVAGTTRGDSNTLKMAEILAAKYRAAGADVQVLDLAKIPKKDLMPNRYWNTSPTFKRKFESPILNADGVVLVAPEYNGSFPGILKHFMDLLKYPDSFKDRPVALVGVSAGRWGNTRGVEQLTSIVQYPGGKVFAGKTLVGSVETSIKDGQLADPDLDKLADKNVSGFLNYVERNHIGAEPPPGGRKKIVIVAGTSRAGSNTMKAAEILKAKYEAAGEDAQILDLAQIPPEDLQANRYWNTSAKFKQDFEAPVMSADGLVIVAPEYNGSSPGILKHFMDLLKYPDAFKDRPIALVGVSAGRWGDTRGIDQLSTILQYPGGNVFPGKTLIPSVDHAFQDGVIVDPGLNSFTDKNVSGFLDFLRKNPMPPREAPAMAEPPPVAPAPIAAPAPTP